MPNYLGKLRSNFAQCGEFLVNLDVVTKAELVEFGDILRDILPGHVVNKLVKGMKAQTCRRTRKNGGLKRKKEDQILKAQILEVKMNNNDLE